MRPKRSQHKYRLRKAAITSTAPDALTVTRIITTTFILIMGMITLDIRVMVITAIITVTAMPNTHTITLMPKMQATNFTGTRTDTDTIMARAMTAGGKAAKDG